MQQKALKLFIVLTFSGLIAPHHIYAYLDPGSGSYLIQIIVASVAGFGYLLRANWAKIKDMFTKKDKKITKNEKSDKLS